MLLVISVFVIKKMNFLCSKCLNFLTNSKTNQPGLEFIDHKEWQGHSLKRPSFFFANFVSLFCQYFDYKIDSILYIKNLKDIFCREILSDE